MEKKLRTWVCVANTLCVVFQRGRLWWCSFRYDSQPPVYVRCQHRALSMQKSIHIEVTSCNKRTRTMALLGFPSSVLATFVFLGLSRRQHHKQSTELSTGTPSVPTLCNLENSPSLLVNPPLHLPPPAIRAPPFTIKIRRVTAINPLWLRRRQPLRWHWAAGECRLLIIDRVGH